MAGASRCATGESGAALAGGGVPVAHDDPVLEVTNEQLPELAERAVTAGQVVTGVQRKLSVHLSRDDGRARLTSVGYPAGYILKPQSPEFGQLPENEQLVMTPARDVGIRTVPHALIHLADGSLGYITRRVDRRTTPPHAIAMEDCCQLAERLTEDKYRGSYEQVGKLIARYSARPGIDLTEYFLVVVYSFLMGNADLHCSDFLAFGAAIVDSRLTPERVARLYQIVEARGVRLRYGGAGAASAAPAERERSREKPRGAARAARRRGGSEGAGRRWCALMAGRAAAPPPAGRNTQNFLLTYVV